ncbi:type VI secretion protein [Novosphingobium umbonatum]|uniref:Type VI secretion protein n=1 Tax=Novosphingobium umbonatum TaxID=1908524 RepID=A0A3S2UU83_9SPHN|nr:TrbG/VirB9 family P-type conjugative transfer protein [Novosphingobium umbonatum]RVU06431.1 type VI secretion protein [Novosphingobium umbonatum]
MRRVLALIALLAPVASMAEVVPRAGGCDPHIQTVAYDANEVVALRVASGFALTVRFAADERIETVTLGDPQSWSVQTNHRADTLVIKPLLPAGVTNLTVVSDARTYAFALYGTAAGEGVQAYLLTFTYPAPPVPSTPALAAATYRLSGDKALWPVELSDDGHFTRLRWAAGVPMPAVYRVEGWGRRALVNGALRDGAYVVEGVFPRLMLVLGGQSAQVRRAMAKEDRP